MEVTHALSYAVLAEAFCYPSPGQLESLEEGLTLMPPGSERKTFAIFLDKISRLSLSEWEELHTRTLDLNPPAAPYIGFQIWGESYQRGIFLSNMNRALMEADVDSEGELPDHLVPVLRYVGQAASPIPELIEIIDPAITRILNVLRKADPANPYIDLLESVQVLCKGLNKEAA